MSDALPLAGQVVIVTRAVERAEGLAAQLEALGAQVERLPLFEVVPPADAEPLARAYAEIHSFRWVVFTSSLTPVPSPDSVGTRVAAIGPATAEALRAHGIEPDLIASESHGLGLAKALLPHLNPGDRVLLPQASDARTELADALRAQGVIVVTVVAYEKRSIPVSEARRREIVEILLAPRGAWVTFTSPRIVRELEKLLGAEWPSRSQTLRAVSIGPTTCAALRERGVEPSAVAAAPSEDGLVAAIVEAVARG